MGWLCCCCRLFRVVACVVGLGCVLLAYCVGICRVGLTCLHVLPFFGLLVVLVVFGVCVSFCFVFCLFVFAMVLSLC